MAGGGAPRKRDSVLSRGSLPTILDDEDGGGPGVNLGVGAPGAGISAKPRARFRESMMALILPARRRTSVRISGSGGDEAIPEGGCGLWDAGQWWCGKGASQLWKCGVAAIHRWR